jgi:UDP-N-acetylmuramoylalanine--D-glutamate ligase
MQICADMTVAVQWLETQAQAGDCILLSPACASLDMYRNYAHRAQAFIEAVEGLQS